MQLDHDVREVLLAIRSLLQGVSAVGRSPNFDALRDIVELALYSSGPFTRLPDAVLAPFNEAPIQLDVAVATDATSAYRH